MIEIKQTSKYQIDGFKKKINFCLMAIVYFIVFTDHKKMAGALERCHFCFGNVPKHLIIAIGTKVNISSNS